ncbi:importin subunit alpha-5-like [Sycon ciliatum]|uniref:importin subunit alpha-5-like n=1 Tax=Sycon ciliatum TaxID=27933 RepID=UPI0020A8C7EB|eukprot:scpid46941/ scgid27005/ Importin subunit alpha-2; Importin alpha P1; Karyopherin subunit alpha-2; Pendulin; Pore targeting complex 58 kDa subunit; RAG cohort protein 1; SRP1-alpha
MPVSRDNDRIKAFKNKGKDQEEMRRRRNDMQVELRKAKREEQMLKRRNIAAPPGENSASGPVKTDMKIPELVENIHSNDPHLRLMATTAARSLVTDQSPLVDEVIAAGLLPKFVEFLSCVDHPELQFESAWTITNVASGTRPQTQAVVQAGAVPILVRLLTSTDPRLCEQAAWALGNISGDGPELRDFVIRNGIVPPLISLIRPDIPLDHLRTLAWCLANVCRHRNPVPPMEIILQVLPSMSQLLYHTDKHVVAEITWAFVYVTDGSDERIEAVVAAGVLPRLVVMLTASDPSLLIAAVRAVGNIVSGTDTQTQAVIEAGALNYFATLAMSDDKKIQKEVAWTISNITAGTQPQIQCVIDAGLVPPLISMLERNDYKVQREAAWAVTNLTAGGTKTQTMTLVNHGVIEPFCKLLSIQDAKVIVVLLGGLGQILEAAAQFNRVEEVALMIEEAGGVDRIEELQDHPNKAVAHVAFHLICRYFSEGDASAETANLNPQAGEGGFQFGAAGAAAGAPNAGGFNF